MADKNKEHGPHGPDCSCDKDDEVVAAGMALATCLSEILPALLARWAEGDNGVTVDFRFDRGSEYDGIAVRVRPLDESNPDWPLPDADHTFKLDIDEMATESLGSKIAGKSSNGKDYVH